MRRLLCIATFVLLLAWLPALAQHGGARASGGGHAGFSAHGGGFGGHVGGGRAFSGGGGRSFGGGRSASGMRSGRQFVGRGLSNRPSYSRRSFRGNRFASNRLDRNRFDRNRSRGDHRGDRSRHRRFRDYDVDLRNCYGWNCGWGWGGWPGWYAGYYDPWLDWWWWDDHSSYDADRAQEIEAANEMNQQSLEEQRARREEDQDSYARSDPEPRQAERMEAPTPATVLVFRDQHKQEVQNYAIVGQTLWAFGASRTQKIPLADLDIAATAKANDERGVDFHVPSGGEGQ